MTTIDLVERLRATPNWQRQSFDEWKTATGIYDRAPFEAADEIERLRAALAAHEAQPQEPTTDHVNEAAGWAELTTDELQLLPRKLLDLAGRVRTNETLFRDDDLIDTAAHALNGFLRQYTAEATADAAIEAAARGTK